MRLLPGLVSVTFRALAPREIVRLAASCGLKGIEWGGDVHVPDAASAREVRRMTEDAGLSVAAYGSYWRAESLPLSGGGGQGGGFSKILEVAAVLEAPTVRVWAGARASAEETDRRAVADALRDACELAAVAGTTVSLEWHDGTLTDTLDSALRLVRRVDHPALRLYWQPSPTRPHAERLNELYAVLPWLSNLHIFQWTRSCGETIRHPLAEGEVEWREAFAAVSGEGRHTPSLTPALPSPLGEGEASVRYALLEFVPGDDHALLPQEAATLRRWLS